MVQKILVVEDDPAQQRYLETIVANLGYETLAVSDGDAAVDLLIRQDRSGVDLVLLDLVLPKLDGFGVLQRIDPVHPDLQIIVFTMSGGIATVAQAMRYGATDFLVKPVSPERVQISIETALKISMLTGELSRITRKVNTEMSFDDLIAVAPPMRNVVDLAKRAASSNVAVLLEGESGVGKEMIARAVQGSSERAGRPFITVNCSAILENQVESILFGHERGAFAGAEQKHIGKFQEANGGTLFLDEVGELTPNIQAKLLRVLQDGEIVPVGSKRPVNVDIRLISATNRDLLQLVEEKCFREDLHHLLNVFLIHVPPLRARRSDIPALVRTFVQRFAASENKAIAGVEDRVMDLLVSYPWPGNVQQLENAVFRAVVLADRKHLQLDDFGQILGRLAQEAQSTVAPPFPATAFAADSTGVGGSADGLSISAVDQYGSMRALRDIEDEAIRIALDRYNGQMSEVARRLGIGRSTLYRKISDLGINVDRI